MPHSKKNKNKEEPKPEFKTQYEALRVSNPRLWQILENIKNLPPITGGTFRAGWGRGRGGIRNEQE